MGVLGFEPVSLWLKPTSSLLSYTAVQVGVLVKSARRQLTSARERMMGQCTRGEGEEKKPMFRFCKTSRSRYTVKGMSPHLLDMLKFSLYIFKFQYLHLWMLNLLRSQRFLAPVSLFDQEFEQHAFCSWHHNCDAFWATSDYLLPRTGLSVSYNCESRSRDWRFSVNIHTTDFLLKFFV